jgi:hypothetical protein
MATTVPTTATSIPTDLKGEAGSGLATTQTQQAPVSLSPGLKEEIKKIVWKYAANKASLTTTEFLTFLKQEQHVCLEEIALTVDFRSPVRGRCFDREIGRVSTLASKRGCAG